MTDKICPKNHKVGTKMGGYACSQRRCAEEAAAMYGAKTIDLDALRKEDPAELAFKRRAELARLPANLKAEEAAKWAQDKMVELLPEAVANVAHDLRYGTDKQRAEATDRVLRANGMDKGDAKQAGQHGVIVLNLSAQAEAIPWLSRMKPAQVVDATPTKTEEPK